MPVRIYALAKELEIDSKELVDICTRIGIQNKGSALASLDDDETVRVRKYLQGSAADAGATATAVETAASGQGGAKAAPTRVGPLSTQARSGLSTIASPATRSAPGAPIRPAVGAPIRQTVVTGRAGPSAPIRNLVSPSRPGTQAPVVEQPEEVAEAEVEIPAVEEVAVAPVVAQPDVVTTPVTAPVQPPANAPFSREDYVPPPTSAGNRIRVLGRRTTADKGDAASPTEDKKRTSGQRREPVINLARIPKGSQQTVPPPKSDEPAPQRPEIRLTKEVISGHKQGMKAPLEELMQPPSQTSPQSRSGRKSVETKAPGPAAPGGLSQFKAAADKAKGKVKSKTAEDEEEELAKSRKAGVSGIAAARAERTKRRVRQPQELEEAGGEDSERRRGGRKLIRKGTNTAAPRKDKAVLEFPCSVRSFSEAAGVPASQVLRSLMGMGRMLTINANLDLETAELLATELDVELELRQPQSLEDGLMSELEGQQDEADALLHRPPIVTFLGHVDHGKTSLLDYLIGTRIVAGEAGGITQHIRAYQVEKDGKFITFVDTPGHEAFTEMRARGANVTDIAILVIAADDGIMRQTEEAISHAKAAGVPIVVAMNKIDLPGADPNRVLTQMTEHGLTPSEWGGDVEVVRTSAITGQGMDTLLETLLTIAELHDYRANPNRSASGVCLEAEQAADKGVIAKVVVRSGTLKAGDIVLCGSSYGRVKALYDTLRPNRVLDQAGPSMPVSITGLDAPPGAGDRFFTIDDIAQARQLAESRATNSRAQSLSGTSPKVSFETFQELLQSGKLGKAEEKVELNLIIRADVRGSLEAIEKELSKIDHPEVLIRILQKSVGGISVADVTLAHASQAVIVGFNVIPDEAARALADERNVEIRRYDIIYKLTEDIRAIVEGRLRPEQRVVELGRALVKTVFVISRVGAVAGCYVAQGTIERGCRIRVNRDGRTIGDYALDSLKRHKDDVKEVPRGMECGMRLSGFNDLKQDDVLEAYRIEEFARKLDS